MPPAAMPVKSRPVRFLNCLLQGKWEKSGDEFASFFSYELNFLPRSVKKGP
jgi:hypothetical protein